MTIHERGLRDEMNPMYHEWWHFTRHTIPSVYNFLFGASLSYSVDGMRTRHQYYVQKYNAELEL